MMYAICENNEGREKLIMGDIRDVLFIILALLTSAKIILEFYDRFKRKDDKEDE